MARSFDAAFEVSFARRARHTVGCEDIRDKALIAARGGVTKYQSINSYVLFV